jgi:hypothetical protein
VPAPASPISLHYETRWAGLPAGDIDLRLDDWPDAYRSQIEIRTAGVPRWLTGFRAHAVSEGRRTAIGLAEPGHYDATYDLRSRKHKRISIRFVPMENGTLAERGAEDSSEKYLLGPAERTGVVDPLAALTRAREAVRSGLAATPGFRIPVFDGKRRFDVESRGLAPETLSIAGKRQEALHLELVLHPIAGFKEKDPEGNPNGSPRPMDVYLSKDEALIPLRIKLIIAGLPTIIEYAGRCDGPTLPCKAGFE